MSIFLIATHLGAFVGGGAVVWFYKSYIQAGVVTLNQDVKTVKAATATAANTASTVVNDIKKV